MPAYRVSDGRTFQAADPGALVNQLRAANVGPVFAPGGTAAEFTQRSAERATVQTGEPAVRYGSTADWYADMSRRGLIQEIPAAKPPDFERSVTIILATFTAFTGFTINGYLQSSVPNIGDLGDWRWWGFFSLVTLLLRYIFGSAIHLNAVYVGKSIARPEAEQWMLERQAPRSRSTLLLFKDLLFLVVFGMLAIYIEQAAVKNDILAFVARTMIFLGAGFFWSVSDYFIRRWYCRSWAWRFDLPFLVVFAGFVAWVLLADSARAAVTRSLLIIAWGLVLACVDWCQCLGAPQNDPAQPNPEWPSAFWWKWVWLDGLQFFLAWLILILPLWIPDAVKAALLAVVFIVMLFFDFQAMIRALQRGLK